MTFTELQQSNSSEKYYFLNGNDIHEFLHGGDK